MFNALQNENTGDLGFMTGSCEGGRRQKVKGEWKWERGKQNAKSQKAVG
jgi:hypothetical protein